MTLEELEALVAELIGLVQDGRMEVRALRQMLGDYKVIDEAELAQRIIDVTREEQLDLKVELYRRAMKKAVEDGPVQ